MKMKTMQTNNDVAISVNTDYCADIDALKKYVKKSRHPVTIQGTDGAWYVLKLQDEQLIALPEKPTAQSLEHLRMTDGYVGAMGKTWKAPTPDELEIAICGAMEIEQKTRAEIMALLESGKSVRWCKSTNYYYDHSYGTIGRKRPVAPVVITTCDCGHETAHPMSASLGTSCPDCYDRMSN